MWGDMSILEKQVRELAAAVKFLQDKFIILAETPRAEKLLSRISKYSSNYFYNTSNGLIYYSINGGYLDEWSLARFEREIVPQVIANYHETECARKEALQNSTTMSFPGPGAISYDITCKTTVPPDLDGKKKPRKKKRTTREK